MNVRGRRSVLILCCALLVAGVITAWTSGTGGAAQPAKKTYPLQVYGTSIIVKSQADPNFCLESAGSNPGRQGFMGQCAVKDLQHWMFAQSTNNAIVVIDGDGHCLNLSGPTGTPIQLGPCTYKGTEQFLLNSSTGQIESTSGKQCLETAKAAQNAAVFEDACQPTNVLQRWSLAR